MGAVAEAEDCGWLGPRIGGTAFSFPVHIYQGAGHIFAEKKPALLKNLLKEREASRVWRPSIPPTEQGFCGRQPTVISNV